MSTKKRILFVDDEVNVLQGLKRGLRGLKKEWDMEFASGGKEALDAIVALPLDAVVTDMQMPEVDGLRVLIGALEKRPEAARCVLSGQTRFDVILRAAPATHLVLFKPCDTASIEKRVKHVMNRNEALKDESLRRMVAQVAAIPCSPELSAEAIQELESENPSMEKVAQLVATDMGMAASVLRFVNSGYYFGIGSPVSGPERAVGILGPETVRGLLDSSCAQTAMKSVQFRSFDPMTIWHRSAAVSVQARAIAMAHSADPSLADDAFAAGLFHDVGQVALAYALGPLYESVMERSLSTGEPVSNVERNMLGTTHAEVGAYLLGLWGMPDSVVNAVALHHTPLNSGAPGSSDLTAGHLIAAMEKKGSMDAHA